ncbi:MAG: glycosyltransferase family 4 protein [Patescibacteria group bacterium]
MRILSLGLDKSILDKGSKLAKRVVEYSSLVDGIAFIAPDSDHKEVRLSEKVFAYGSGGRNKIFKLINIYRLSSKILKLNKFDVITVQDQYYLALIGLFLSRRFKVGLELQVHGFEKYSGLRKIIAGFVIPRANAIRCVSQRLKRQLMKDFGIGEEKITVTPIYVESRMINNELPIKQRGDKFIFLTVGRLVPVKNIGLQIRATTEVIKKYQNVEFWIVGDGSERKKLENEALKFGVKNNVKFLGWQNNPDEFYSQADAFLLTSNDEGWGMVAIEAMSHSLPVVMTDVGCAGEFIKDGENGIVIPINDQAKLEETMVRLIGDENLRKKLAEGALSAIKNLPTKEETLALYKQSWEKAMKNK